ncbi:B-box zinc finger protein 22-like [Ananas comosus]|uniref:B-box zinc finger protein 22-like n=1 Tax=Ananas comosus TaxID=4615 RepID=A0A6P5GI06_ANACO|nr:B-box zinc finger protein 22-like [Ananas comosus]XP_020107579.1 B-box zinc finger protein 22-like [Ananas comosus]
MKIQCDVCARAEAAVLCCADEAALCWGCDDAVHAANKLAGKHHRVPLLPPTTPPSAPTNPTCDICQEKAGYFFCLEDRALLCRNCDVSVHTASPYVSSHQRFLITGVRVALQHYLTNANNNSSSSNTNNSSSSNCDKPLSSQPRSTSETAKKLRGDPTASFGREEVEAFRSQWPWNEILENVDFDQYYGLSEPGSSS